MVGWSGRALAAVALLTGLLVGLHGRASAATPPAEPAADLATAAYAPVTPCRAVDSRTVGGRNESMVVTIAGTCGVPADATAVVVTLTVVNPVAAGYLTAYPAGTDVPIASNVNFTVGATVANTAAVPLGEGRIVVFSNVLSDKVVDVVGYFAPASQARAGRFVPVAPTRLVDTRAAGVKVPAGGVVTAALTGVPEVPADAVAVAVNLTFTESTRPGFFTAFGDGPLPSVSTGNVDAVGQTRAVFTVAPLGADGVHVFSQSGAHVVVDLVGYVTGPSAEPSSVGLFVPGRPTRVLDTRGAVATKLTAQGTTSVPVSGGAAVWANVTAIDATRPGFFAAWAAGTPLPATSSVNATAAGQVVANAAITRLSDLGLAVFAQNGGHVAVDVAGVFTGAPVDTGAPQAAAVDEVIGTSVDGRPIVATHVLAHPGAARKVLVLGFMHGEEQAGVQVVTALRTAPVPAGVDLWLMDTMNPDGGAAHRRTNSRGVDLNRNFTGGAFPWCPSPGCGGVTPRNTGSAPMSEPETVAFWNFIQREKFDLIVSYHQPLETVDCAPDRGPVLTTVCQAYSATAGIPYNRNGYIDISGTMTNSYMDANPGKWAFTMEFDGSAVIDAPRHVAAVWAAVAALPTIPA